METKYTIYSPGLEPKHLTADLPHDPGYDKLCSFICPLLDDNKFEHVTVLVDGEYFDMFVDEFSVLKSLFFNEDATKIYRNNYLTQHPDTDPSDLPPIMGPAVLFHRKVWF